MKAFLSKYVFGRAAPSATPRLLSLQVVFPEPFHCTTESLAGILQGLHPSLRAVDFAKTTYSDDEAAAGEMIGRFKWSQAVPLSLFRRDLTSPPTGSSSSSSSTDADGRKDLEVEDEYSDVGGVGCSNVLLTHRVSVVVKPLPAGLPANLYHGCVEEPMVPVPPYEADAFRHAMRTAKSLAYLTYRTESATALPTRGGAGDSAFTAPLHRRYEALTMVAASLCRQRAAVGVLNADAHTCAPATVLTSAQLEGAMKADGSVDLLSHPSIAALYCGLHAVPSLNRPAEQLCAYRTTGGAALLGQPDFVSYAPSLSRAEAIRGTAAALWYDALRLGTPLNAKQLIAVPAFVGGKGTVLLERPNVNEINATGGASRSVLVLAPEGAWREMQAGAPGAQP